MKHSFEKYCTEPEKIENYEKAKADNFIGWEPHHRLETHNSDGERRLVDISAAELKALDMYYNRPASELIYLPESEHRSLHSIGENNSMYGKHHTEETKKKQSEVKKGEKNPMYGSHWFNNGETNKFCRECPDGFVKGRIRK